MIADGLLLEEAEPFEVLMDHCRTIEARANRIAQAILRRNRSCAGNLTLFSAQTDPLGLGGAWKNAAALFARPLALARFNAAVLRVRSRSRSKTTLPWY